MLAREVGLFFAVVLKDLWGPVDDCLYQPTILALVWIG